MTHKLTIEDVRKSARCASGTRELLARNGWSESQYWHFLRNGMDLDEVRALAANNGDIQAAIACAEERIAKEEAEDGFTR